MGINLALTSLLVFIFLARPLAQRLGAAQEKKTRNEEGMMSKHIPTVALGAFLAGAFLLLGAAHSTGQNKGTPPPPPTPPAQPGQPGARPMPPMPPVPPDKDKAK